MTNEEKDIIARFVARYGGAEPQAVAPGSAPPGSVPSTAPAPTLPPVDAEADQWIGTLFAQYPEARYRITQLAFLQEAALTEAQHRIERLEWEAQQIHQQAAQQQVQPHGILGGLFGGNARPMPPASAPPSPPQYAPYAPQPQMFQQGSGFLGGALRTAAGVAGGMMLGNTLMNLFGGRSGYGMGGFGGGSGGGGFAPTESVTNNYFGGDQGAGQDASGGADPWAGGGGTLDNSGGDWSGGGADPGTIDQGGDMGGGDQSGGDMGGDMGGGGDFGGGGGDMGGGDMGGGDMGGGDMGGGGGDWGN